MGVMNSFIWGKMRTVARKERTSDCSEKLLQRDKGENSVYM